jgi:molybdopterin/thiamine biosynthesis adenylyltransferase
MSTLKFTNPDHWALIEQHLAQTPGERFAFALTNTIGNGTEGPVLGVVDVVLVDDRDIEHGINGWYLADHALDRVHNHAVAAGHGLVEFHNHHLGPPGFSHIDETALTPRVGYVLELLHGTPYGAGVWAQGSVRADWWRPDGKGGVQRDQFRTVTVIGDHLRVINAHPVTDGRFTRQLPLLGSDAQAAIAAMRVAVVGAGGTGSHVALNLAYLGLRDVLVLDDDLVETSNLPRLVTADHADTGSLKTVVARRRMRAIDPLIRVRALPGLTVTGDHPELHNLDLIIGCVDHDGPRHRLNQIAVDTRTPYIDIATGVDDTHEPVALGGRVVFVLPDGPCLTCLDELDSAEIARWAKPSDQQALDRLHGYGTGTVNPSVVHLNGLAVNAALAELVAWLSGARRPARWLDIDLLGNSIRPGIQIGPREVADRNAGCIDCGAVHRSTARNK